MCDYSIIYTAGVEESKKKIIFFFIIEFPREENENGRP